MWVEWWSHTPVLQQQLQQQPEGGQHVYIPDRHLPVLAQCLPETQAERLVIIHVPVMMVNGDLQTHEFVLSWEHNLNYCYCLCCPDQQQLHCCCFHHHHYCCFPIPSHSQPPHAGHGYYGLLAAGSSPCGQPGAQLTVLNSLYGPVGVVCVHESECESDYGHGHECELRVAGGCHGGQAVAVEGSP